MIRRCVPDEQGLILRHLTRGSLLLLGVAVLAAPSWAQVDLGPVTVGGGIKTSFDHTDSTGGSSADKFQLDNARIYVSGNVTESIKLMFNTEYDSISNKIGVLDAVAEFSISPQINIWAGRFLPPSDRANLYGPFYAHEWLPFTDGIQDGYPFVFQGRDNGAMWWGDFLKKKMKVSAGAFDGSSTDGNKKIIGAARVQFDFWDPEDGYYLNGTYYGDKNLLSIGGATQVQDGHTATTVDFLMEKKLPNGGVVSVESEFADYNRLGGYNAAYAKSNGEYGLASYLFPKVVPIGKLNGKFEILGKYARANYNHGPTANYDQKTTEINFNYVIKQFKARVMSFYEDTRYNRLTPNTWLAGIGLQVQI
jgi:hypothetical protein